MELDPDPKLLNELYNAQGKEEVLDALEPLMPSEKEAGDEIAEKDLKHQSPLFIKKLDDIDSSPSVKIHALRNYVKSELMRMRMIDKFKMQPERFRRLDRRLYQRYTEVSDANQFGGQTEEDLKKKGAENFLECQKFADSVGCESEGFALDGEIVKGEYQRLADGREKDYEVTWKPEGRGVDGNGQ